MLRWSQARKQYERQGLLAEEQALENAETECLKDGEARARHREREAERRIELDADSNWHRVMTAIEPLTSS